MTRGAPETALQVGRYRVDSTATQLEIVVQDPFDLMASAYSEEITRNVWNALYERPAILDLAGNVAGLSVLDAGCGSGAHAYALRQKGASICGFDASAAMLSLARKRLGPSVDLRLADLTSVLPYDDGQFDLVMSALVLHYVEDWRFALSELARVLRPGGRLVFSTHHPFMDHQLAKGTSYFDTYCFEEQWERGGAIASLRFWHRPLSEMFACLRASGFRVDDVREPMPLAEAEHVAPEAYKSLISSPRFIFLSAVRT